MNSLLPRCDGVHHVKLPVADLERSSTWYSSRLGYESAQEVGGEGQLIELVMRHPRGGPQLGLWLDPPRAGAAAGVRLLCLRRS